MQNWVRSFRMQALLCYLTSRGVLPLFCRLLSQQVLYVTLFLKTDKSKGLLMWHKKGFLLFSLRKEKAKYRQNLWAGFFLRTQANQVQKLMGKEETESLNVAAWCWRNSKAWWEAWKDTIHHSWWNEMLYLVIATHLRSDLRHTSKSTARYREPSLLYYSSAQRRNGRWHVQVGQQQFIWQVSA